MIHIMRRDPPAYAAQGVGIVAVEDGQLVLVDGPDDLRKFLATVTVTATGDGHRVAPSDPKFEYAAADSIGRQSAWRFTGVVK